MKQILLFLRITYVIFILAALNPTSFTIKLDVPVLPFDGIGRTPKYGGGASKKEKKIF